VFAPKVERMGKEMKPCFFVDVRNGRQTGTLFNKTGHDQRRKGERTRPFVGSMAPAEKLGWLLAYLRCRICEISSFLCCEVEVPHSPSGGPSCKGGDCEMRGSKKEGLKTMANTRKEQNKQRV
jgi:hypothetical protein